jgi:lipopolysaccharide export system protein LptC
MDRRPYFAILALAFVALATQALVWVFVPREDESTFIGPPRSDYTLTDFTLDALDEQGHHAFTMVAPRLARKEGDGSIYVTTPKYEIVDNDGSLWKGHSEAAWVN